MLKNTLFALLTTLSILTGTAVYFNSKADSNLTVLPDVDPVYPIFEDWKQKFAKSYGHDQNHFRY